MAEYNYTYIIVGGGLAGASAAEGIREIDQSGSILLISTEHDPPYHRPPLTKDLWVGKKTTDQIYVRPAQWYKDHQVEMKLDLSVTSLDVGAKTIKDENDQPYHYEKLLLATGGRPRHVTLHGSELDGICYFRYVDDYHEIRRQARPDASAVVIGGGFIGSEIAAALNMHQVKVSMIFPESYLVARVFPDYLGNAIQHHYQERGIGIFAGDKPVKFEKSGVTFITHTEQGHALESDMLIVGVGIYPDIALAESAGLKIDNGILVDEYLRSSSPDIYAAGDNANFPYQALGQQMRIEHWDNALSQGKHAGRNMAGANEQFTYMPYFYSDLFEFGYEAVGEVTSGLETFADWVKENDTGIIYYLKNHKVRGVMTCNIYGKLDQARDLIRSNESVQPEQLRGAISTGKKVA